MLLAGKVPLFFEFEDLRVVIVHSASVIPVTFFPLKQVVEYERTSNRTSGDVEKRKSV